MNYLGKLLIVTFLLSGTNISCKKSSDQEVPEEQTPQEDTNSSDIPEMVLVNGGTFKMGNDGGGEEREKPAHDVSLNTFKIAKTPVTVAHYRIFCSETKREMPKAPTWGLQDNHPVVGISWHDAASYCVWLSEKTKQPYRLPTEAEWEYASKGGKSNVYIYSGSNEWEEVGWRGETSTKPVAQKKPNELGIYDMSGNVWEWCSDWYNAEYYAISPSSNPKGPTTGSDKVLRGGGYNSGIASLRSEKRHFGSPDAMAFSSGFRIVLEQ